MSVWQEEEEAAAAVEGSMRQQYLPLHLRHLLGYPRRHLAATRHVTGSSLRSLRRNGSLGEEEEEKEEVMVEEGRARTKLRACRPRWIQNSGLALRVSPSGALISGVYTMCEKEGGCAICQASSMTCVCTPR